MRCTAAALAALLTTTLAACDQSPAAPRQAATEPARPDPSIYRKKLLALSPEARGDVLFKAIASGNGACPSVEKSAYQEDYKDMSMWAVQCALSGDWAVFVNGSGFAQVRQCDQETKLGLPACKPLS